MQIKLNDEVTVHYDNLDLRWWSYGNIEEVIERRKHMKVKKFKEFCNQYVGRFDKWPVTHVCQVGIRRLYVGIWMWESHSSRYYILTHNGRSINSVFNIVPLKDKRFSHCQGIIAGLYRTYNMDNFKLGDTIIREALGE